MRTFFHKTAAAARAASPQLLRPDNTGGGALLRFIPGSASELTGFICMILQRLMYSDFDSGF